MQNMINEFPMVSYFVLPNINSFFTYVPLTLPSSENLPTIDYQPNYFFPSQIDPQLFNAECINFLAQSSNNLQQSRDSQNQTNIQGSHPQKCETTPYSPIVLSSNRESNILSEKLMEVEMSSQNSKKQNLKQKKGKIVNIKSDEDRDYNPLNQRKRKTHANYQQNENRNIIPNEINQIFSFLQKRNKSGPLLEKMFNKFPHPAEFTPKRYYLYQGLLKNKLGHYTNENSLKLVTELYEPKCESWSENEQRFYNKISRVLIRHFLHQDSIFIILTSKRMKSSKKADHIRARRHVKQSVLRILKGY